jgi:hypothetical protein
MLRSLAMLTKAAAGLPLNTLLAPAGAVGSLRLAGAARWQTAGAADPALADVPENEGEASKQPGKLPP